MGIWADCAPASAKKLENDRLGTHILLPLVAMWFYTVKGQGVHNRADNSNIVDVAR